VPPMAVSPDRADAVLRPILEVLAWEKDVSVEPTPAMPLLPARGGGPWLWKVHGLSAKHQGPGRPFVMHALQRGLAFPIHMLTAICQHLSDSSHDDRSRRQSCPDSREWLT